MGLPLHAKARMVCRGYTQKDIVSADGTPMKREVPTLSRVGFYVLLQVLAIFQWPFWQVLPFGFSQRSWQAQTCFSLSGQEKS